MHSHGRYRLQNRKGRAEGVANRKPKILRVWLYKFLIGFCAAVEFPSIIRPIAASLFAPEQRCYVTFSVWEPRNATGERAAYMKSGFSTLLLIGERLYFSSYPIERLSALLVVGNGAKTAAELGCCSTH